MRKVEYAAGVAALLLCLAGVTTLLFAPLVTYCAAPSQQLAGCATLRYTSLASAGLNATSWAVIGGMVIAGAGSAVGAIGDARYGRDDGVLPLWAGTGILLLGVVLTATWAGPFFLPALLALGLASYASARRRRTAHATSTEI